MVSSTLNPQAIIGNSQATFESFGNFMTGGNLASSSIVSNAANKIVNFNRPEVAPIKPNLSSLISNISTNILNQVDNSINNITNVTDGLENSLNKLKIEFFNRLTKLSKKFDFFQSTFSQGDIPRLETQIQTIQNSVGNLEPQVLEKLIVQKQDLETQIQTIQNSVGNLEPQVLEKLIVQKQDLETQIQTIQNSVGNLEPQVESIVANPQVTQTPPTVEAQTPVSQFQQIIQNIQGQITNVLDNTIRNFSKDYQQKVKGFDDTRPNNVLTKFLDLYKNAIGFVNFFGDRKNIGVIETNLKALRKIFQESFEVAAILRQTIIKIVKQLSNLPSASPTSVGLNLDINVPGGRLRQGANAARIGNIARKGGIVGSSLLAAGGLAAAATGMGRAKEYQESLLSSGVTPATGEQYIPENIVESFSVIVDRFVAAVNSLISGAKSYSSSGAASGGGASASPGGGPSPGSGPGSSPGVQIKDDTQGLKELGFTQEEWNAYKQGIADVESAKYTQMGGSGSRFAGRYQMGDEAITEAAKVLGIQKPTRQEFLSNPELQEKMYMGYTISNYRYMKNLSPEFNKMTREQQLAVLPMAQLGIGNLAEQLRTGKISRDAWGTPTTKFSKAVERRMNEIGKSTSQTNNQSIQTLQVVAAAPTQTQANQAKANTISQPAQKPLIPISASPTIIDAGGGGQAQQGSSTPPAIPSQPPGAGPEVPMLSTSNPDNFLTMYSRIVYNIVDG